MFMYQMCLVNLLLQSLKNCDLGQGGIRHLGCETIKFESFTVARCASIEECLAQITKNGCAVEYKQNSNTYFLMCFYAIENKMAFINVQSKSKTKGIWLKSVHLLLPFQIML